ncbi:MAG: glucose 1-dehydrogenase [Spirochaetales bacterium]|jgi:NAD(P)-dependent dehydrogenase (short-subunit alcohol dehydrogenase family)|nr:glucose 1-dehydrogenase [Spirochaetales bacterium]
MAGQFSGKTALVTGAGSGIGKGVALRLAREGANVAVADINQEGIDAVAKEIAGLGVKSLAIKLDISKVEEIRSVVGKVVGEFGGINIFVNTAGIVQSKKLVDVTEAEWDRLIDINQKGTAFADQIVGAQMIAQIPESEKERIKAAGYADKSWGKIVNFASVSGRRGREYQLCYSASKFAVISITQSAALAFAPWNINVNGIAPSVVETPMWAENNKEKEKAFGIDAKKASDEFIARIPLKRPGTVEDMAGAVAFLCSKDADYITGQTLNVCGGFEMD